MFEIPPPGDPERERTTGVPPVRSAQINNNRIENSPHNSHGRDARGTFALIPRLIATSLFFASATFAQNIGMRPQQDERLSFQAIHDWEPRVNVDSDVAMAYGIDESLPARLATWKNHGYLPEVMTGVSWGEYQDYYYGKFDGKNHLDEAQTMANGEKIGHGRDVYYMCPSEAFGRYLCVGVKRALDAGATGIYLEEPEFWVRAGWSEGFKREWQDYYHEPWISPDSSPDAQYRASKLKYFLYRRALSQVFEFVKQYGKDHNREIHCYVPTHSMINYANWGIVSPESSLLQVGCDGYIAQVWTGTARTPNVYEGQKKERTFETAFLEYGSEQNLVRASGRRMWYLNDPIEDDPNHTWTDYRTNWQSTLIASLLQPEIYRYEVMPWPHRIFHGRHPATQPIKRDTPREPIPSEYETELQAVISAMGDMKQPDDKVKWLSAGTPHIGVLVSDTMMFQRWGRNASDPELGSFYGLSLPLIMHGIPVEPVQIETADLSSYKVLLLTYEGQKPPDPKLHESLAKWVRAGGALIVIDDDKDAYNAVHEWWNTGGNAFATPREHLFSTLGIPASSHGVTRIEKGVVIFANRSPAHLSHSRTGADTVRELVRQAMMEVNVEWKESGALVLRRGPYVIAAGLDDPVSNAPKVELPGSFISLFDPGLPVVKNHQVLPGSRALLVDLNACSATSIVAAASKVRDTKITEHSIDFTTSGIESSNGIICLKIPAAPTEVTIESKPAPADSFAFQDGVLRLHLENQAPLRSVQIKW